MFTDHFLPLYDQEKRFIGVFLSPALWAKAEPIISPAIDRALEELDPSLKKESAEPMNDWEALAQFWDFQYPLPKDVSCDQCGNETPDWMQDTPRKFKLRSATIGGLVNFECQTCNARILKKHFKKHVDVECRPFIKK
ncbi:MAG: hypothetical protein HY795_17135 [Desulfovibrio sp.]|nr:hypothetical protein [Desulfovibrio sp.]